MGQAEQEGTHPIVVVRDHNTRVTFAHMLQGKSTTKEEYSLYVINAILRDIEHLGHKKIVFKTDQEAAMKGLQERIRMARSDQTILENSPVEESQSNGVVEKAIQEVEGMVRTLKSALEERIGHKIKPESPILGWLIEHAASLITMY